MLSLTRIIPLLIVASVAALSASCTAGAPDDGAVGIAAEPIVRGPGAFACYLVASNNCGDWRPACSDPNAVGGPVICAGKGLTCDAAEHAASGDPSGMMYCYRLCEHLP